MAEHVFGEFIKPAIIEFFTKYNSIVDRISAFRESISTFEHTVYPNGPYSDPDDHRYLLNSNHSTAYDIPLPPETVVFTNPYSAWNTYVYDFKKCWIDQFKFGERRGSSFYGKCPYGFATFDIYDSLSFIEAATGLVEDLSQYFYNHEKRPEYLSETVWTNVSTKNINKLNSFIKENLVWNWESLCEKYEIPLREGWDSNIYSKDYYPWGWPKNNHEIVNKLIAMLDSFQYLVITPINPFVEVTVQYGRGMRGTVHTDYIALDDAGYKQNHATYVTYWDDWWDRVIIDKESGKTSEKFITGPYYQDMPDEIRKEYEKQAFGYADQISMEVYNKDFVKAYETSHVKTDCITSMSQDSSYANYYYIGRNIRRIQSKSFTRIYNYSGRSYSGTYGVLRTYKNFEEEDDHEETFDKVITIPPTGYIDLFPEVLSSPAGPFYFDPAIDNWVFGFSAYDDRSADWDSASGNPNDVSINCVSIQKI